MKVSIKFEKQAMRNVRIALMKDLKGVEERGFVIQVVIEKY